MNYNLESKYVYLLCTHFVLPILTPTPTLPPPQFRKKIENRVWVENRRVEKSARARERARIMCVF